MGKSQALAAGLGLHVDHRLSFSDTLSSLHEISRVNLVEFP